MVNKNKLDMKMMKKGIKFFLGTQFFSHFVRLVQQRILIEL